jgi:hypothetical protein
VLVNIIVVAPLNSAKETAYVNRADDPASLVIIAHGQRQSVTIQPTLDISKNKIHINDNLT